MSQTAASPPRMSRIATPTARSPEHGVANGWLDLADVANCDPDSADTGILRVGGSFCGLGLASSADCDPDLWVARNTMSQTTASLPWMPQIATPNELAPASCEFVGRSAVRVRRFRRLRPRLRPRPNRVAQTAASPAGISRIATSTALTVNLRVEKPFRGVGAADAAACDPQSGCPRRRTSWGRVLRRRSLGGRRLRPDCGRARTRWRKRRPRPGGGHRLRPQPRYRVRHAESGGVDVRVEQARSPGRDVNDRDGVPRPHAARAHHAQVWSEPAFRRETSNPPALG